MNQEFVRRAIEAAMQRRVEQADKAAALEANYAKATDWYAFCSKCGEKLTGTLAELKAHKCGE